MAESTADRSKPSDRVKPHEKSTDTSSLKMLAEVHKTLGQLTVKDALPADLKAELDFSQNDIYKSNPIFEGGGGGPGGISSGKEKAGAAKGNVEQPLNEKPTHPFSIAEVAASGANNAAYLEGKLSPNSPISKTISQAWSILYAEDYESPGQLKKTEAAMKRLGAASGVGETSVGDCGFESSLAGLARTKDGPEQIAKMISQTPEQAKKGMYTVRFPGDEHNPITVSEHEIKKYGLDNSAQWANVIEAAAIKRGGGPNGSLNGIPSFTAETLLTGKHTFSDVANGNGFAEQGDSSTTIARELAKGLSDGGPVVAGTTGNVKEGLVSPHYYTVLGYDAKTKTVVLRNPVGTHDGAKNLPAVGKTLAGVTNMGEGEVRMSLSTFMKDFNGLSYTT